tara:strand:+ start:351 stop:1454 length:1104 start_codon:yes stop_codon:yes gene_type:complete
MAKKKQRSPYLIKEPNWAKHTLAESEEDKKQAWENCWYFIHYEISSKECYNSFRHWTKTHSTWTKEERKKVLEAPDYAYLSISEYTYFHSKVGFMTPQQEEYIYSKYDYFLQTAEKKKAEKVKAVERKVVPIRQELSLFMGAVDEAIDKLTTGKKVTDNLLASVKLNKEEAAQAHKEISVILDEFKELVRVRKIKDRNDWDDQLVEGYSHLNTPNTRKLIDWLEAILLALMESSQRKTPVRRKKAQDPRKIVARLRHLQSDKDLGIASVNPVDILGSSEVWVYDTKRRRLGLYKSKGDGGLGVKGTSITGYEPDLSYEKTLRKPDEQLQLIMKKSKNALHDVVGKIRGKQMKVKTRINPNMLLLKVQ